MEISNILIEIDNKTIVKMIKEAKAEGYKYLYVITYIYGSLSKEEGKKSYISNCLKFYKSNNKSDFECLEKGILYSIKEIII